MDDCRQNADIELRLRGCSRLIESSSSSTKVKALAHNTRGNAHLKKKNYDRAIADYSQAILLSPDAIGFANRGNAYAWKGDQGKAFDDCDRALRLNPNYERALVCRGNAFAQRGENSRAMNDLEQAIRRRPDFAFAYASRARVHERLCQFDSAISDFNQSIRLDPKDVRGFHGRARVYGKMGDHAKAISDHDHAIRLEPDYRGYNGRAWAYFKSGQAAKGLPDVEKALVLVAASGVSAAVRANILDTRGHILLTKGDLVGALADFDTAIRLGLNSPSSHWGRGQVYALMGNVKLAIEDYRSVSLTKDCNPEYEEIRSSAEKAMAKLTEREAATLPIQKSTPIATPPEPFRPVPMVVSQRRIALVIGNSGYRHERRLSNPGNDAAAIAAVFRKLGFAEVIERMDSSRADIEAALKEFGDKAVTADWAVVYYSGHGLQVDGRNYLVPVDARLERVSHVQDELVHLDRVVDKVAEAKLLRLVILDACRDNPFLIRMQQTAALTRNVGRGLARTEAPRGTLIAYAAREGQVADDGPGKHSPFTQALLEHLEEPGLEIGFLFRKVRDKVYERTRHRDRNDPRLLGPQEPFTSGSLPGNCYFFKDPKPGAPEFAYCQTTAKEN